MKLHALQILLSMFLLSISCFTCSKLHVFGSDAYLRRTLLLLTFMVHIHLACMHTLTNSNSDPDHHV